MSNENGRPRVVVTGLGAITPLGGNVETTWRGLVEGCSGVEPITAFDTSELGTKIAAAVKGFNAGEYMDPKEARRLTLFIQFGIAAATQAVAAVGSRLCDSGLDPLRRRTGERAGRNGPGGGAAPGPRPARAAGRKPHRNPRHPDQLRGVRGRHPIWHPRSGRAFRSMRARPALPRWARRTGAFWRATPM